VAEQIFFETTGSNIIADDLKKDASVLVAINKLVNKGNRFGLVVKLEATDVMRAIQTFTTLATSLGVYEKVMPPIMDRAVNDIRNSYPEVTSDSRASMGIGEALETVANWLERVADRDPALFKLLSEKMRVSNKIELKTEGGSDA
jgi:hypothetical protein